MVDGYGTVYGARGKAMLPLFGTVLERRFVIMHIDDDAHSLKGPSKVSISVTRPFVQMFKNHQILLQPG
jgi:hypothetical protein